MADIASPVTKTYRRRRGDPTYQDLIHFIAALVRRSGRSAFLTGEEMKHKTGTFLGVEGNMEKGYLIQVIDVPVDAQHASGLEENKKDAIGLGTG